MSFPPYTEYKDSEVSWAQSIPAHWNELRLAALFDLQRRDVEPEHEVVTAFRDGQVTLRSIRREDGFTFATKEIGYQGVATGDLVIHAMDAFAGAIGVSEASGKSTPVYSVCSPKTGVDARFYAMLLRTMALAGFVESLAKGVRERSTDFRWRDARDVRVPVPPYDEQRAVVAFLDRETAKIDAAVAAQERLITLLAEKRAATISHAVTKGFDPDAPMKDSGIEWLGQIPAHWSVPRIGWKLDAKPRYGVLVPDDDPDGVPMLRIKDLTAEVTDTDSLMTISAELSAQYPNTVVEEGDLLISVVGTIGSTRIVGPELAGVNLSRAIARLRPSDGAYTPFLRWIFESQPFTQYVDLTCTGTAQRVLNMDDLSALRFAFPEVEEQQKISGVLDRTIGKFDDLINRARQAMELLTERRAALISAAVTGKIDVRGEVAAQEQEAA